MEWGGPGQLDLRFPRTGMRGTPLLAIIIQKTPCFASSGSGSPQDHKDRQRVMTSVPWSSSLCGQGIVMLGVSVPAFPSPCPSPSQ